MKKLIECSIVLLIIACTSCKKDAQDLLIGRWNYEKRSAESPVGGVKTFVTFPTGAYMTFRNDGTFEELHQVGDDPYTDNWAYLPGSSTEFKFKTSSSIAVITQLDKHNLVFYVDGTDANNNPTRYYNYLNK